MIQRPGLHRDGDLGRVCLQVDVVGELRVPVTEAVGRLFQAFEIVIGASPQCFFGSRLLVLEFLELRDIVEQVREVGVVGPHDLRLIGDIGRKPAPRWRGGRYQPPPGSLFATYTTAMRQVA